MLLWFQCGYGMLPDFRLRGYDDVGAHSVSEQTALDEFSRPHTRHSRAGQCFFCRGWNCPCQLATYRLRID